MSELPDHILEVARQRGRALPPWTDAQLAELARIVDGVPRDIGRSAWREKLVPPRG